MGLTSTCVSIDCCTANETTIGGGKAEGDSILTGTTKSHQGHDVRQSGQSPL